MVTIAHYIKKKKKTTFVARKILKAHSKHCNSNSYRIKVKVFNTQKVGLSSCACTAICRSAPVSRDRQ